MSTISKIRNFMGMGTLQQESRDPKNIGKSIRPAQLQRIKQDTATWREAVEEAERAHFPFRVQMQTLFIDTVLNGHVSACIERRKDLTLLRDFQVVTKEGKVDDKTTKLITGSWFTEFLSLSLDALFFGYSLISLGDIVEGKFKDVQTVKRWNVSPDRLIVSPLTYDPNGISFDDKEHKNWHVYVKTSNNTGSSPCGFGLLYNVGIYEIFLRNILGYNGDFVELYSQPYRIGTTSKMEGAERDEFERAVAEMGSSGYLIKDNDGDTVEFLESSLGGNGWQGYDNFEQRIEENIQDHSRPCRCSGQYLWKHRSITGRGISNSSGIGGQTVKRCSFCG
jgi:hypothetical protein